MKEIKIKYHQLKLPATIHPNTAQAQRNKKIVLTFFSKVLSINAECSTLFVGRRNGSKRWSIVRRPPPSTGGDTHRAAKSMATLSTHRRGGIRYTVLWPFSTDSEWLPLALEFRSATDVQK
jgi:hypothetical protein